MDISKSLFGLLKNNGMFKSVKQANFLLSKLAEDLTYYTSFNYNLGSEYNYKPCGSSSFTFFCDQEGVVKVIKRTGTNKTSIYFERLSQQEFKDKQDKIENDKLAYQENRRQLDLLVAREERIKGIITKRIKQLTKKELLALGLEEILVSTVIGNIENLSSTDWVTQKEKHFNRDKRYTSLYNAYLLAVQATYNFPTM